jgi:hypothetical protein
LSVPSLVIALTATQIAIILGFSIGFLWGEAFSGFDGQVKYENGGPKNLSSWEKFLLEALLDANHHFQYGLALMLIVMRPSSLWIFDWTWLSSHPTLSLILLWMGWGLVVSDWKDYKHVLSRLGSSQDDDNEPIELTEIILEPPV